MHIHHVENICQLYPSCSREGQGKALPSKWDSLDTRTILMLPYKLVALDIWSGRKDLDLL